MTPDQLLALLCLLADLRAQLGAALAENSNMRAALTESVTTAPPTATLPD